MTNPDLSIIEAKGTDKGLPYEFKLQVKLANPNAPKDEDGDGVPDAPAARPPRLPPAPAPAPAVPRRRRTPAAPARRTRHRRSRVVSKKKIVAQGTRLQQHRRVAAAGQDRLLRHRRLLIVGLAWYLFVSDKQHRTGRPGAAGSRPARRVRNQAGPRRQPRAAQAAARADGAAAAADAAPAAEQDRDARPDRRHLADRARHRHHQRAVPAGRRSNPRSSTPRSRSRCAWWAPTTSSAPSSAAWPRCRAW